MTRGGMDRQPLRRKRVFITCSAGFTSHRCCAGWRKDINQMVLFRLLQGVFGAALVPLSQP